MKIIIDEFNTDIRIDAFLADYMQDYSRSKIQSEIKKGSVFVNNKVVKSSYSLREGDLVEFNPSNLDDKILPENIPLNIVWEDDNMAVVNKPSGMLTHPTTIEKTGTLVNALLYRYGNNLSSVNGDYRRGIVHRLDRNTSGLLMIAKNDNTHNFLVDKMKNKEIEKRYIAIVKGVISEDSFEINKPIIRNPHQSNKMMVSDIGGKESLSIIKVLKRFSDATLVEILLITGRTHQIRVHMSSIGHPVYNDTLYGFGKMKVKTEEQVLESYKLSFPLPFTNVIKTFQIDYDEKIKKVLNYLGN